MVSRSGSCFSLGKKSKSHEHDLLALSIDKEEFSAGLGINQIILATELMRLRLAVNKALEILFSGEGLAAVVDLLEVAIPTDAIEAFREFYNELEAGHLP